MSERPRVALVLWLPLCLVWLLALGDVPPWGSVASGQSSVYLPMVLRTWRPPTPCPSGAPGRWYGVTESISCTFGISADGAQMSDFAIRFPTSRCGLGVFDTSIPRAIGSCQLALTFTFDPYTLDWQGDFVTAYHATGTWRLTDSSTGCEATGTWDAAQP